MRTILIFCVALVIVVVGIKAQTFIDVANPSLAGIPVAHTANPHKYIKTEYTFFTKYNTVSGFEASRGYAPVTIVDKSGVRTFYIKGSAVFIYPENGTIISDFETQVLYTFADINATLAPWGADIRNIDQMDCMIRPPGTEVKDATGKVLYVIPSTTDSYIEMNPKFTTLRRKIWGANGSFKFAASKSSSPVLLARNGMQIECSATGSIDVPHTILQEKDKDGKNKVEFHPDPIGLLPVA